METSDFTQSPPTPSFPEKPLPRIGILTMFRLGLFQMGLGIMAILTLGILNRVMISELGINPAYATGVLAMHHLVAPARIWFGHLPDAKPLLGYHRGG